MVRKAGDAIGALAIVVVDNPMVPGHRPPHLQRLHEGLHLPEAGAGQHPADRDRRADRRAAAAVGRRDLRAADALESAERARPYALPYNGHNVLVVGLGPAGYTLAHYLLNEGFGVVAIDGLKIEPLPAELTGGRRAAPPQPIEHWDDIYAQLDERVLEGFGGVSEYGITVRWDKNFLTLLHLTLARRDRLRIYGGVRFGGTLPIEDAWAHGFDHIAIAAGAGKPTVIDMKNNLVRGVRKASDFLMALQLTGAFKRDALPNLQARLPAVVIGGGLTGIDTATELFAYYPVQVEKTLDRYEALCAETRRGCRPRACTTPRSWQTLDEFLAHGRAVRAERTRADAAGEAPDFVPLVRGWGGVTLAYRKRMIDSPGLSAEPRRGHQGARGGDLVRREPRSRGDRGRRARPRPRRFALRGTVRRGGAAGANRPRRGGHSPNIIYEKERPGTFELDAKKRFFQGFRAEKRRRPALTLVAGPERLLHVLQRRRAGSISFYGDNHPAYAGNVVKAMASAKDGYRHVVGAVRRRSRAPLDPAAQPARDAAWDALVQRARQRAAGHGRVGGAPHADDRRGRRQGAGRGAPLQSRPVLPPAELRGAGRARRSDRTTPPLLMEGIALTGAWVDKEKGCCR